MQLPGIFFLLVFACASLYSPLIVPVPSIDMYTGGALSTVPMPDISGIAWIEQDTFLAVHDAKNPEESHLPRVSLLWLPRNLEGVRWKALKVNWPPPLMQSSDLESIARIPGTSRFLLVESGESIVNGQRFSRLFLAELRNEQLEILSFTQLPATVRNIEGSAVVRLGGRYVFVWAERGDGKLKTELFWADLELEPVKLGSPRQTYFKPGKIYGRYWRPVSAIEIDSRGQLYIASAFDPEDDNGPFTSAIWHAGQLTMSRAGRVMVNLFNVPRQMARLDGLKVEALAIRERERTISELFAGTDDENYGAVLRRIPNLR